MSQYWNGAVSEKRLENRIAIVTGAAGARGMGRSAALRLAREGAAVAVLDLVPDEKARIPLENLAEDIRGLGVRALALGCDVTNDDEVVACVEKVAGTLGGVDVLFNNAGVGTVGLCEDTPIETYDQMYRVNVRGTVSFTKAVIAHMKQRGGGTIINNASIGGLYGDAHYSAYDASKFAVVGFTKAVALELGRHHIRVNAVCPGIIDTDMGQRIPEYFAAVEGKSVAEVREAMNGSPALRRWGHVDEVSAAVAFLASDDASYVTGVALPVAGGLPPAL